ncbi:MAG: methionine biosynthesis protein MetW [Actinobacteria bacterium]|nr:methionine biosynthesis protein MetW [Actinomycetota bacterium]
MSPYRLQHIRLDLQLITDLIDPNSSVLDLGCGDGALLRKLFTEKGVHGHGVEFHHPSIYACIEKGVPVIYGDLDEGLNDYPDKSFNYVVMSRTIQVVKKPHVILNEMLRVGKIGIVSFINFGYWPLRSQLFFRGRMPQTKTLPFQWYNTPNIHLSTIKDIREFCRAEGIIVHKEINLVKESAKHPLANLMPNLFADLAIFVLQKNDG